MNDLCCVTVLCSGDSHYWSALTPATLENICSDLVPRTICNQELAFKSLEMNLRFLMIKGNKT